MSPSLSPHEVNIVGVSEREVKIKVDCELFQLLHSKLESLGFDCKGPIMEIDIYYSHPCRDFVETDEALRLRFMSEKQVKLTYKGPRRLIGGSVKEREEIEVVVENANALESILLRLGFKPAVKVKKRRTYCSWDGTIVVLDKVEKLGCFVEVEASDERVINEIIESIGLSGAERIELTYAEMLSHINPRDYFDDP